MDIRRIELPLRAIQTSGGFALDIGGSVAKLIYRSKDDYDNGIPRNKAELESKRGQMCMIHMAREKIEQVIDYIIEHCDVSKPKGQEKVIIYSTGLGGNQFKEDIEKRVSVELKNLTEFDCFVNAVSLMLKTLPPEDVFMPVNQLGIEQAKLMLNMFKGFKEKNEETSKGSLVLEDNPDVDKGEDHFPFLMVMCGSGCGFMKVERDGSFRLVDGTNVAGRFFLGLTSFLTGVKKFDEIGKLLDESDGKTVDTFGAELVSDDGDDVYSCLKMDFRIFPFGKGLTDESDKATKGDLIHSLLETICENKAQLVTAVCQLHHIKRAYFVGNFVCTPKAQQFLTRTMHLKQHTGGQYVHYEFIKNGGHMGAVGSLLEPYLQAKKAEEKAAKKKKVPTATLR